MQLFKNMNKYNEYGSYVLYDAELIVSSFIPWN